MDRAFDFAAVGSIASAGFRVIGAMQRGDVAFGVLVHGIAGNEIGTAEADFATGCQALELFDRFFHKVIPFDIEFTGERHFPGAAFGIFRIVDHIHFVDLTFREIVNNDFEGIQHCHSAGSGLIQIFADAMIQQSHIRQTVEFGNADLFAEIAESFRRNAAAAERTDRRHTGIVPSVHIMTFHQFPEFAFAHHCVSESKPGKFDLTGFGGGIQVFNEPIVQRAMHFKFQCADGMGDPLNGIFQRMSKIVQRIDAPLIAGIVMFCMTDPVNGRIAHVHIRVCHVDLGTENFAAVGELTVFHAFKKIQVFFHRAVAIG